MMINSLCLVRLSALGDVVLAMPLVRSLQAAYPAIKITWVTTPQAHSILAGLSGVNFIVINKPKSISDYWQFYQTIKNYRFDVLLAVQASWRANLLYPLIRAERKIGFDSQRSRDGHAYFVHEQIPFARRHLVETFLQFAEYLGIAKPDISWDLAIPAAATAWAAEHCPAGRFFVLNPMASKLERTCEIAFYQQLITTVRARWHYPVLLTGGMSVGEREFTASILKDITDPGVINFVGQTTPKQLAAVLKRAEVLIAPDTGPVHIATAVGTPVIGLYAVATPELSGPYGQNTGVIDRYPEAVKRFLAKSADTVPWGTRVHYREAMGLIHVDDVVEKLWALVPC